ncbi:MAG: phosphonate C-P lyase system protein PhnL [Magnetovibrionaceae bacterium]
MSISSRATRPAVMVEGFAKSFTLHNQGGVTLPVLEGVSFTVEPGECVVLHGPSGTGKSSLLRAIYANYVTQSGKIWVRHNDDMMDVASAAPRDILAIRRASLGFVSQFLRAIPRVAARDVVAEPLRALSVDPSEARSRAESLLARLNIPERLWGLAPGTFSGGEQQRVNIARGFVHPYPVLLLDEPTASLDAANRAVVVQLIEEAKVRGAAIIGVFHDSDVRDAVSDRLIHLEAAPKAA